MPCCPRQRTILILPTLQPATFREIAENFDAACRQPVTRKTENSQGCNVSDYQDVFALDDSELGCTDVVEHDINTGNSSPIKQQPYGTPVVRSATLKQIIHSAGSRHFSAFNKSLGKLSSASP